VTTIITYDWAENAELRRQVAELSGRLAAMEAK